MIATKEQELKALEKIKKIVADLGEGSYIGAAFDGCFEDAEGNIQNDFCASMKQRFDVARDKNSQLQGKLSMLEDEVNSLTTERNYLKERTFTKDEINRIFDIVNEKCHDLADESVKASDAVLKLAADLDVDTAGDLFLQAVQKYRRAKKVYEDADKLRNKVREIMETYYE